MQISTSTYRMLQFTMTVFTNYSVLTTASIYATGSTSLIQAQEPTHCSLNKLQLLQWVHGLERQNCVFIKFTFIQCLKIMIIFYEQSWSVERGFKKYGFLNLLPKKINLFLLIKFSSPIIEVSYFKITPRQIFRNFQNPRHRVFSIIFEIPNLQTK